MVKYAQGEWHDKQVKTPGSRTYNQVKSMVYALSTEMKVRPARVTATLSN